MSKYDIIKWYNAQLAVEYLTRLRAGSKWELSCKFLPKKSVCSSFIRHIGNSAGYIHYGFVLCHDWFAELQCIDTI